MLERVDAPVLETDDPTCDDDKCSCKCTCASGLVEGEAESKIAADQANVVSRSQLATQLDIGSG